MHKKTVLQVVPSLISGGVERGTLDVAKALVDNHYRSMVISSGGALVTNLTSSGSEHIKMKVASKNPLAIYRNYKTMVDIIKSQQVDLIHARSRAPAWSAYMASKETGARFVTTFHGIYNFSTPLKKLYNSIMVKGERVIAVSNFVKQHILENYNVLPENIRVINRGVDYNYFNPANITPELLAKFKAKYNISRDKPIILLPARMTAWKGHMILIEALHLLKGEDFCCIIVGDLSKHPGFAQRLQRRIVELKLQSKVQIFGPEVDMLGLYAFSDIVLSTSIEPEAFGRVVIEAQAMEKLTIATNIGGAAETIIDEVTGYHIQPGDSHDLADKIRHCLNILGTTRGKNIAKEAREFTIKNFSLDLMMEKTLSVYKELI